MFRRPVIFLAAAAALAGGTVGTIQPVKAAGVDKIQFSSPFQPPTTKNGLLAPNGSLTSGQTVTVTLTALSSGAPVPNEPVFLELNHEDPGTNGGQATVGGVQVNGTAQSFTTDGSGNITIQYTAPDPTVTPNGRDLIFAQDVAVLTAVNSDAYDSSPVVTYVFNPAVIAPAGSLAPGTVVPITLTAEKSGGAPVGGADILLNMSTTSATGGGSATASSAGSGSSPIPSGPPVRFTADLSGNVTIMYTVPSAGFGTDTIKAIDHSSLPQDVHAPDAYTYCASTGVPLVGAYQGGTAPQPVGLAGISSDHTCVMAGGTTGFQGSAPWLSVPFFGSVATLSGDVTGGGTTDLVAVNSGSTWVATSSGTGFNAPAQWSTVPFYGSVATLIGDVNHDGKADLIAVNSTSTWVMTSNSTGTGFNPPARWSSTPFYGSKATLAADVSGSNADLVAVNNSSTWVMTSNGSNGFNSPAPWSASPFYGSRATLAGDVNHDGKADLIAVNDNSVWVMTSTGTGFNSPQKWSSALFYGSRVTLAGDLNGDGSADLIAVNPDSVWALVSNGSSFNAPARWATNSV